jgi:hypothetical protein
MNEEIEIWKDVIGYKNCYQVSNLGRVKSLDRYVNTFNGLRLTKGIILKQGFDKDGYCKVNLKNNSIGKSSRVHRLVCESFLKNSENKPHVNHINGIKNDNTLFNLEWCSLSENRVHSYKTGLQNGLNRRGAKSNFVKLTIENVKEIRATYKKRVITQKMLAKKFNVTQSCIHFILKNRNWNYEFNS